MSAPTDLLLPERITATQRWAATGSRGVQAVVTLLVEHDTWLRRADFLAAATFVDVDENMLAIRWRDAATFVADARGSSFELAMLELAIALGTDRYRLGQAGGANSATIRRAVEIATGGAR